jgi:hypothetical protein
VFYINALLKQYPIFRYFLNETDFTSYLPKFLPLFVVTKLHFRMMTEDSHHMKREKALGSTIYNSYVNWKKK